MNKTIQHILIFAAFVAPLGAKFLAINTPIGALSPFRISIILAFTINIFNNNGKIKICKNNKDQSRSIMLHVALLVYAFITLLWAKDTSSWTRSVFFLSIAVIAIILYTYYFNKRENLLKPIMALCFGIGIQSLIGWYEVVTRVYIFRPDAENLRPIIGSLGLPVAMQNNTNNFALLMFFGSCIALICMIYSQKWRLIFAGFAINFGILAFLTGSRATIIAYLLAIVYLLLKVGKRKLIVFFLPLIFVLLFPQTIPFVKTMLQFNFNEGRNSDYVRSNLIRNGFLFLKETFGMGVGAGQIPYWVERKAVYYTYKVYAMHNFWMELLTSYGIVFFVAYIVNYIRMFLDYRLEGKTQTITMGAMICAVMVGFVVGGVGPSSTMSLEWLWLFWGLCIAGQKMPSEVRIKDWS